jgi:exopolyphosphatase/guanosine-5'-triphosphate,3'-diphosphate pyrophosphatase
MINLGDCSFNIIMSTEIIGLSHKERTIVANVVRYNHEPFDHFGEGSQFLEGLSFEEYLVVAKLTAILRIADALDASHKQKSKDISVQLNPESLHILCHSEADMSFEMWSFEHRSGLFQEVIGIKPELRVRRTL